VGAPDSGGVPWQACSSGPNPGVCPGVENAAARELRVTLASAAGSACEVVRVFGVDEIMSVGLRHVRTALQVWRPTETFVYSLGPLPADVCESIARELLESLVKAAADSDFAAVHIERAHDGDQERCRCLSWWRSQGLVELIFASADRELHRLTQDGHRRLEVARAWRQAATRPALDGIIPCEARGSAEAAGVIAQGWRLLSVEAPLPIRVATAPSSLRGVPPPRSGDVPTPESWWP
jgi:hypothetical protein